MKNGKIIFEEERQFLIKKLGVDIPTDCWRDGSKIYLDCTCEKPLYVFRVQNKEMVLTKNNTCNFKTYKQKKVDELLEEFNCKLNDLENKSVEFLVNYLIENNDYEKIINAHSSGKDSVVSFHIFKLALDAIKNKNTELYEKINPIWITNFANTTNDTGDTYKFIKTIERVNVMNPEKGLVPWIREDKKYRHPTALMRTCCEKYKEGQLTKHFNKNSRMLMITGVRKYESSKRSNYEYVMNHNVRLKLHKKSSIPELWDYIAPIVEWKDFEVWLYILRENLEFNKMYMLGFHRVGCLNCCFQQDYIDLLTETYYPKSKKRWDDMLRTAYKVNNVGSQLKWTEEEYVDSGKWKSGTGYEYYITGLKRNTERIRLLAKRKGCAEEVAAKFWDKECSCCGKKMNPSEISMSLKLIGRESNKLCKNCLCDSLQITKDQYKQTQIELYNSECTLF